MLANDALSGNSTLAFHGSGVTANVGVLFMREGATLNFVSDAGGISALGFAGAADLFGNIGGLNPRLSVDVSAFS